MTRKEKEIIVEKLAQQFSSTSYFYIINATGLTVEEVNDFRKRCFQAGILYQVVKNTLITKALKKLNGETDYAAFSGAVLQGFSGILFIQDVASTPARIIKEFRKQKGLGIPILKGASIDYTFFIGDEYLDTLSELKSKAELLGDIILLLQSPVKHVIASLQSGKHQLSGIVKALSERTL